MRIWIDKIGTERALTTDGAMGERTPFAAPGARTPGGCRRCRRRPLLESRPPCERFLTPGTTGGPWRCRPRANLRNEGCGLAPLSLHATRFENQGHVLRRHEAPIVNDLPPDRPT